MGTVINKTVALDMRGKECAFILVGVKKTLKEMAAGETLEVLCTDYCTEYDLPSWAKRSGHEILAIVKEDDYIQFTIKKN